MPMALNQKLSPLLEGRMVHTIMQDEELLWIIFTDHSEMRVKIAAPVPHVSCNGRIVQRVQQEDTWMSIDFDDKTNLEITLAAPTACVMLRKKDCSLEYAD
jgi:hypothetical protein